jgi:D-3-phosphoglycerate dehydrogenase
LITQYAPVSRAVLESSRSVQAVVRYGVGLDCIDTRAASELRVKFSGVSDYCTTEVADHTVALILSGLRSVPFSNAAIKAGQWPAPASLPLLTSLAGKKVGLVGFGRIAQAVAARLRGFECQITAYDPYVDESQFTAQGVVKTPLAEVLGSDVVSLHVPATPETDGLINGDVLARIRPGSVLVNVSRGALLDEQAVGLSLDVGQLAVACLDVFRTESASSALTQHPKVIATPHTAYYSEQSLRELRTRAAYRMVELLKERRQ